VIRSSAGAGASGQGKTRLALELAEQAGALQIEVLAGECLPPAQDGAGTPLQPLRRALLRIASHCRQAGPAETEHVLGARAGVLAAYVPELARLQGPDESEPLAPLPPDAAHRRLFRALAETLAASEQALALARQVREPIVELQALTEMGDLALELGRAGESRDLYEQALTCARRLGMPLPEALILAGLGALSQEAGDPDAGRPLLQQALLLARDMGDPRLIADLLTRLARLERRAAANDPSRRFEAASRCLAEAAAMRAGVADVLLEGLLLLEGGYLELAQGRRPPEALLVRLRELAQGAVGERGRRDVQCFEQALSDLEAGQTERLCCGERIDDLPDARRRWTQGCRDGSAQRHR
jgi:tetratricopeptide (TPR) repeat protein